MIPHGADSQRCILRDLMLDLQTRLQDVGPELR